MRNRALAGYGKVGFAFAFGWRSGLPFVQCRLQPLRLCCREKNTFSATSYRKRSAKLPQTRCHRFFGGLRKADCGGLCSMRSTSLNPSGISNSAGSNDALSISVTRISFFESNCFSVPSGSLRALLNVVTDCTANPVSASPMSTNSVPSGGRFPAIARI